MPEPLAGSASRGSGTGTSTANASSPLGSDALAVWHPGRCGTGTAGVTVPVALTGSGTARLPVAHWPPQASPATDTGTALPLPLAVPIQVPRAVPLALAVPESVPS